MKKIALTTFSVVVLSATFAAAQAPAAAGAPAQPQRERRAPDPRSMGGGDCRDNPYNCADAPNPLPAANTVWLEEMTWMDVRDALKAGKTNIIISTGGIEPNGPWLVTGKHNYVLHANCEAIARKMGNTLCAPIVKYVPEGDIATKSGHMASPGTITMREETFRGVLRDAAESLQSHGFKNIIFIGDSGGNQAGQKAVAEELNAKWAGKALALHIAEYYDYASVAEAHEQPTASSTARATACTTIRSSRSTCSSTIRTRCASTSASRPARRRSTASTSGDKAKNTQLAKQIVEFRATQTIAAINKAIAAKGKTTTSAQ